MFCLGLASDKENYISRADSEEGKGSGPPTLENQKLLKVPLEILVPLGSKLFDTLRLILKGIFEKVDFENKINRRSKACKIT